MSLCRLGCDLLARTFSSELPFPLLFPPFWSLAWEMGASARRLTTASAAARSMEFDGMESVFIRWMRRLWWACACRFLDEVFSMKQALELAAELVEGAVEMDVTQAAHATADRVSAVFAKSWSGVPGCPQAGAARGSVVAQESKRGREARRRCRDLRPRAACRPDAGVCIVRPGRRVWHRRQTGSTMAWASAAMSGRVGIFMVGWGGGFLAAKLHGLGDAEGEKDGTHERGTHDGNRASDHS
jgi:hypothetical protein